MASVVSATVAPTFGCPFDGAVVVWTRVSSQSYDDMGGYFPPELKEIEKHNVELSDRMTALALAFAPYQREIEQWVFQVPMLRGEVDFLIQTLAHYDDEDCADCAEELDDFLRWVLSGFARVLLAHEYAEDTEEGEGE